MSFNDLGLSDPICKAVSDVGYTVPTPIQEQAIPVVLMGRDLLATAQTGTGKTAAFTLPMIDILSGGRAKARMPRSLILEPTRELAAQVAENFDLYGKNTGLTKALIIGGESMEDQLKLLERGVDVLIATPGRLLDLFERGRIILSDMKLLVIDEADRMMDMGFIPDIEKICKVLPPLRQTLMLSATLPPEIKRLAGQFLMNPKHISVSAPSSTSINVAQHLIIMDERNKREALRHLLRTQNVRNAYIFCNRKRDVAILQRSLERHGFSAVALHGDMVQSARTATLEAFKAERVSLLVCSDVAARGLDVPDVSHVFNFDVPIHAEDYVHRIGRTGRAGRQGATFMLATPDEAKYIAAIENMIKQPIPHMTLEGFVPPVTQASSTGDGEGRARSSGRSRTQQGGGDKPSRAAPSGGSSAGRAPRPEQRASAVAGPLSDQDRKRQRNDEYRAREAAMEADALPNDTVSFGDEIPAFLRVR
jgi:superfamily II DNA/RNA helicase